MHNYERKELALAEEEIVQAVKRLQSSREEQSIFSLNLGRKYGQEWAMDIASFGALQHWAHPEILNEQFDVDTSFPDSLVLDEMRGEAMAEAWNIEEYFQDGAYEKGFLEVVTEVWEQVKDRLG